MIIQICVDYAGLPDVKTMEIEEIRFFYNACIPGIIKDFKDAQKKP
jgi:hypothetical protein